MFVSIEIYPTATGNIHSSADAPALCSLMVQHPSPQLLASLLREYFILILNFLYNIKVLKFHKVYLINVFFYSFSLLGPTSESSYFPTAMNIFLQQLFHVVWWMVFVEVYDPF